MCLSTSRPISSALRLSAILGAATLLTVVVPTPTSAQGDGLDANLVALTYHKLSGDPLDVQAAAQRSDAVTHASNFDRPDVLKTEAVRLQAMLASADPSHEFVTRIDDQITEYDHDRSEFSITLFTPGYYVPIQAFGQQYQIVFANADQARPIPMPKEQARDFDAKLNAMGRRVTNEIHFRVIGSGDPAGAVTGPRVIRAEIISARLLDRVGNVVFTPTVTPVSGGASGATAAAGGAKSASFDLAHADVAGFRVGVTAKDLKATLERLFGPVSEVPAGRSTFAGFAGSLEMNGQGCYSYPGRSKTPGPGAVCVTAFFDKDNIVRSIRVERIFSWMDSEVFRKTLVQKYGPVAAATNGGDFALGWGPEVDPALVYGSSGPHNAITAHYMTNDDFMSRGMNRIPDIRVVLLLVDAPWAALAH